MSLGLGFFAGNRYAAGTDPHAWSTEPGTGASPPA